MNYNEYLQNLKLMQTIPNYQNMANYTYTPQFRYSYPSYYPFESEPISNNKIDDSNLKEEESRNINIPNLNEILKSIQNIVNNQRNDLMLYDYLIGVAPTAEDKRLLQSIKDTKEKNYKKLRELYTSLSGMTLENMKPADTNMPYVNFMEGLRNATTNEFNMTKELKNIFSKLPNMPEHLKSLELVLDSMTATSILNFLLNKNRQ